MIIADETTALSVNWSQSIAELYTGSRITAEEFNQLPKANRAEHLKRLVLADLVPEFSAEQADTKSRELVAAVVGTATSGALGCETVQSWSPNDTRNVLAWFILSSANWEEVCLIFE